jgi:hypothetical protein
VGEIFIKNVKMKRILFLISVVVTLVVNGQKEGPKRREYLECGTEAQWQDMVNRAAEVFITQQRKAYAIASNITISTEPVGGPNIPEHYRVCVSFWWYE